MVRRALVIGDLHIPERAYWIPEEVESEVRRLAYDLVFCSGDLTGKEVLSWLQGLAHEVYVVRGNMDYLELPLHVVINVEDLKVGIYHGSGIRPRGDLAKLAMKAKQMEVEVLVTGHTHFPQVALVREYGVLVVNPGSATGAWGGDERATLIPSFAIMTIEDRVVTVEVKEFIDAQCKTTTHKFKL